MEFLSLSLTFKAITWLGAACTVLAASKRKEQGIVIQRKNMKILSSSSVNSVNINVIEKTTWRGMLSQNIMEANTNVPLAHIQLQERITLIDTKRQLPVISKVVQLRWCN